MRLLTKIGVGLFLSLSLFMLSCSIIRAAGTYYQGTLDFPWQVYWLHAEACIGVTMGSLTVYRSTLVGSHEVSDRLQLRMQRLLDRLSPSYTPGANENKKKEQQNPDHLLMRIPRATLTGLRTFFGVSSHTQQNAGFASTQDSDFGLVEADYHAHIKAQTAKASNGGPNGSPNGAWIANV